MQLERLSLLAKQLLSLPTGDGRRDTWVFEHSQRVMNLAQMIARLPEVEGESADTAALAAAALFHDAGWITEYHNGRFERWQLLTRPTSDLQRELGALTLQEQEEVRQVLPGPSIRLAVDAIRRCNDRRTDLLEARILAEAEALDEASVLYVLRQFRQYQGEGRPIQQLIDSWQRQKEYRYWQVRLQDGFRYSAVRALAQRRLEAVDAFMAALQRDLHGADLAELLEKLPVDQNVSSA